MNSTMPTMKTVLMATTFFIFIVLVSLSVRTNIRQRIHSFCNSVYTENIDKTSLILCLHIDDVHNYIRLTYTNAVSSSYSSQSYLRPQYSRDVTLKKKLFRKLSEIAAIVKVPEVDCRAIFNGSKKAISSAMTISRFMGTPICDTMYENLTSNCKIFKKRRGYITFPLTKLETNFPLAFSIMVYKDAEMVERILRIVYRPQNYYCIRIEKKSTDVFFKAVSNIASCFTNVLVADERIDVQVENVSAFEPELLCMSKLWKFPRWNYYLTLTGEEFPLKTNLELVKFLTSYGEAGNNVAGDKNVSEEGWINTERPQRSMIFSRNFVDFILHNDNGKKLLSSSNITKVTGETLFEDHGTKYRLRVEDTHRGEPKQNGSSHFSTRYNNWVKNHCNDRVVWNICIVTTRHLPMLGRAPQLFANMFLLNEDRAVIGCLEEKIFNNTRDEFADIE